MKLSELSDGDLQSRLLSCGISIRTGPFTFRVVSPIRDVRIGLRLLYADYPVVEVGDFADFTLALEPSRGLRRWFRRQVRFQHDGLYPFEPLPLAQAYPFLEWALNWCIASYAHHYLLLHAAVIERDGKALIMPAPPGSGKSTLCAALVSRGWRLLSDEMGLISPVNGMVLPLGRPISLKNRSLEVIRAFVPGAVLSLPTHDTNKGTVAHMKVAAEHVAELDVPARPAWVVFPRYIVGAPATLRPRSRADSMLELGRNSFNYALLGATGFEVLGDVVAGCDCYDFEYGQLEEAMTTFDALARAA